VGHKDNLRKKKKPRVWICRKVACGITSTSKAKNKSLFRMECLHIAGPWLKQDAALEYYPTYNRIKQEKRYV